MSSSYTDSARPDADIRRITRIFDRRAASFGEVAFLPREVAQRMRERLDYIKIAPATILDAGCGRGDDFAPLAERFAQSAVFGIDASGRMLSHVANLIAPASACSGCCPVRFASVSRPAAPPLVQGRFRCAAVCARHV